jgi:FAD:protein FMN transferase
LTVAALPGARRVEQIMGMPIVVDLRDDEPGQEGALDRLFDWFRWVDATFSTFKDTSEVSRLNRGTLSLEDAHPHLRWVLTRCEELRVETNGYFDARAAAPESVDPSGLVKGWAVDRGAEILDAAGLRNYAINAGGDIRLRGRAVPSWTWRVGIEHPLEHDQVAAIVETTDLAVATSADYARGEHVVDPHTRRAPTGVLSVTITGPELATADAYATAAFAMGGRRAADWTARLPQRGYQALTILADRRVLSTPGFPSAVDT